MKKHLLLILISCLSLSSLIAQSLYVDTRTANAVPCPSDSSVDILQYENWELYQTVDDTWAGIKTNSHCPTLALTGSRYQIDLESVDADKPIFLAYTGAPVLLNKNEMYTSNSFVVGDGVNCEIGLECGEDICSGLILITEHMDPMYPDTLVCESKTLLNEFGDINLCFGTEKTEINRVTKAIYKVTVTSVAGTLWVAGGQLGGAFSPVLVEDKELILEEVFYNGMTYDVNIGSVVPEYGTDILFVHHTDGLPSVMNQSFTEVVPEVNKTEPTEINIEISYTNIMFQKYTHLVGSFVEGSDTLRHPLNLILETDMCIFWVELIGGGGTNFVLRGGNFVFSDTKACIQVRDESQLVVTENQSSHFGHSGIGNLNLRSGGSILLNENSDLTIDAKVILTEYSAYTGDEPIHVNLQKGSHLNFTSEAKIINNLSENELILYVYMNGGTIDMSKLSQEDQNKIILVYPKESPSYNQATVFPNPATDRISIVNPNNLDISTISVYDYQGRLAIKPLKLPSSLSSDLSLNGLESGLYLLKIEYEDGVEMHRVLVE